MPLPECVKVKYHNVGKVKIIRFSCPICGYGGEFYPTDGLFSEAVESWNRRVDE